MEVLFEVELAQLGLLVPVAHAGFGVVAVQDGIVMHKLYFYYDD